MKGSAESCLGWADERTRSGLLAAPGSSFHLDRAEPGEICPISARTPRPAGACFLDVLWQRIEIGLIGLDTDERRVVRVNKSAEALLRALGGRIDYQSLVELFFGDSDSLHDETADSEPKVLSLGSQLLGFTVHRISRRLIVVLLRDITERKRLEGIAEAANLMENIGYVFAGIRHELGNPVNSLKVTLSVLRRQLQVLPPEAIAEFTERAMTEISRIEYLLAGLRSFSMYESVRPGPLDLRAYLRRFVGITSKDLAGRGVKATVEVADELGWIRADERALQQVLLNLLTNALDALVESESPELRILAYPRDTLVVISFCDNGRGMDSRELDDAFKPFHTTKADGSGLGLVIARKMLAAMGGQISLDSRPGAGTAATITLPRLSGRPEKGSPREQTS